MSLQWTTMLVCDECGADVKLYAFESGGDEWYGDHRRPVGKVKMREYARKHLGWRHYRGSDFCGGCAEVGLDVATT